MLLGKSMTESGGVTYMPCGGKFDDANVTCDVAGGSLPITNVHDLLAGAQVEPPPVLSSVNTSKNEFTSNPTPEELGELTHRPSEALLGLSRTITPPGNPVSESDS